VHVRLGPHPYILNTPLKRPFWSTGRTCLFAYLFKDCSDAQVPRALVSPHKIDHEVSLEEGRKSQHRTHSKKNLNEQRRLFVAHSADLGPNGGDVERCRKWETGPHGGQKPAQENDGPKQEQCAARVASFRGLHSGVGARNVDQTAARASDKPGLETESETAGGFHGERRQGREAGRAAQAREASDAHHGDKDAAPAEAGWLRQDTRCDPQQLARPTVPERRVRRVPKGDPFLTFDHEAPASIMGNDRHL
jgi:hypothetical protein